MIINLNGEIDIVSPKNDEYAKRVRLELSVRRSSRLGERVEG